MIRRGFWLALGAALGVTGYRRAGRLARAMLPARRPPARRPPARWPSARGTGGTAAFLRDVRDGMDEYLDRHPVHRGPTLEGQQVRGRRRAGAGMPPREYPPGAYPGIDYAKDGR